MLKQKFVVVILTTSTILTTLKKSIKLEKIKIEDIQFILKEKLIYF